MAKPKRQPEPQKSPPTPGLSPGRKRLFRIVLALLPLIFLCLLELSLRLFGYGYSTAFFIKSSDTFIPNEKFARQFFSKQNTSRPVYCRLPAHKKTGTIRIFVLGESAAMGTPDPAFAFCRMLEVLLQRQFPGQSFEVVNAAMRGIDSYVIRYIARDCAKHEPDLFIVYAGNNEVIGLHGPEPDSSRISQWLPLIRISQALKSTKTGQLLKSVAQKFGAKRDQAEKQDMEFFRKKRLPYDDPKREQVAKNFYANLKDIVRAAGQARAALVLSTVPVNLKDFPPLGSLHRGGLSADDLARWQKEYDAGIQAEPSEAIGHFEEANKIDDHFAELHFRLATALLTNAATQKAQEHFQSACNRDALQFRADGQINESIRHIAGGPSAPASRFVDSEREFSKSELTDHGIPGAKLFRDHVHPTFDGDYLLARSLFPAVVDALKPRLGKQATTPLPSRDECASALAYTEWHDVQVQRAIVDLSSRPPFHDQVNYRERQTAAEAAVKQRLANLREVDVRHALETCIAAVRARPNDWLLRYNCATLFQAVGNPAAAVEQFQAVVTMFPEIASFRITLAQALVRAGRTDAAIFEFEQAGKLDPNDPQIPATISQLRRSQQR